MVWLLISLLALVFWGWGISVTGRAIIFRRDINPLEIAVPYTVILCSLLQFPVEVFRSELAGSAILVAASPAFLMWKIINVPLAGFIWWLLPAAVLLVALVTGACIWLGLKSMAPAAAFVAAVFGAFVMAEPISKFAMCRAATDLGVTTINRTPIYQSLRWLGEPYIITSHAGLNHNGQILYWSYREMTFLPMPDARNPRLSGNYQC